jgi:general secretion pathway protein H
MRSACTSKGFTLLELIVVMAVIALTASLATPQLAEFLFADQLKVTTRKLVGLIHRASRLAQQHQEPYLLKYIDNEHRFLVEPEGSRQENGETLPTRPEALALPDTVAVGEFWTWYGGNRSGEQRVLRFSKEGYVEPTILSLHKADEREMSVVLSPFLGTIRIVDSHVAPDKDTFSR